MKELGKDMSKMDKAIRLLSAGKKLPAANKDHKLRGQRYIGCRECHLEDDWLLVYRIENRAIRFERTGSHDDLFRGNKK